MNAIEQEKPLLSIITICLNLVSDIGQTCESVVEQTWRDFEWIVIDGASTDGTVEVLEKYRSRCAELVSEPDRGIYHAMNKGLRLAKGDYVLFLNGGDRLSSNDILEKSFAAMEHDSDIILGDVFLERGNTIVDRLITPPAEEIDFQHFAAGNSIPHQGSLIRRKLFEEHGFYDESYRIAGDLERWVAFAKCGCSFRKMDAVLSVFKLGGVSDDKQPTNNIRLAEVDRILKTYYTADEVEKARARHKADESYIVTWSFLPLGGGVFLFSKKETRRGTRKTKWCFLGLPVLKKRHTPFTKSEYMLMGIIPLPF